MATLGLAGYIGILISVWIRGELGRAIGFAIALVGFLFSMYLTYREAFTIHAYCQWCLGSAVLMTLLAILTTIRMLRTDPAPVDAHGSRSIAPSAGARWPAPLTAPPARLAYTGILATRSAPPTHHSQRP